MCASGRCRYSRMIPTYFYVFVVTSTIIDMEDVPPPHDASTDILNSPPYFWNEHFHEILRMDERPIRISNLSLLQIFKSSKFSIFHCSESSNVFYISTLRILDFSFIGQFIRIFTMHDVAVNSFWNVYSLRVLDSRPIYQYFHESKSPLNNGLTWTLSISKQ